jgi:hypothetical protein
MRAALRGDFERLHARRRETIELASPVPAAEQDEQPTAPAAAEPEAPRSSWLDRLRDRR